MGNNEIKNNVFEITQNFLKTPPLIIWGSGATIPFGLPSMSDLNDALKVEIEGFNSSNENLETEIAKEKYKEIIPQIKKTIWDKVNVSDVSVLQKIIENNDNYLNGIKLFIEKIINAHPEVANIVTTNYDRVLEHMMSYHNIKFTDGFDGKTLSIFDESRFKNKGIVNLIKVHGSLNWFEVDEETRYLPCYSKNSTPQTIVPGRNKYEEAYNSPYRELIRQADKLINNAKSFLIVGFGFNDKHLTPKVITKIERGTPVVLITKKISDNSFRALKGATKYIFFEESDDGKTKVIYKKNNSEGRKEEMLEGDFWQLNKFMEII